MNSQTTGPSSLQTFPSKPRVFILTDITNEPDDTESFCRYLTYANQFRTEGVVATTSVWLRDSVAPQVLHQVIDGYQEVVGNLNAHVHPDYPYPSVDDIRSMVCSGSPVYGMDAVGDDIPLSEGGELLLKSITSESDDPLWVLVWGGANVLAQVLHQIRTRPDAAGLRAKLRVYTISDQDDCGGWIRQQWPDIFYICSLHGWNQYSLSTWVGISSDCGDEGGPDQTKVTKEWVKKHVQIGPLGARYPDFMYIIEGDTPTFLYLIQNGLGVPEQPGWGSWGGRYVPMNISKKGLPAQGHFGDTADAVVGKDGRMRKTNQATIWRWRNTFQDDFAARMRWTLSPDFASANHHPVVAINGKFGLEHVYVDVDAGSTITFDASATYDPDGDELSFKWWQYREPSSTHTYRLHELTDLGIKILNDEGSRVKVSVAPAEKSCRLAPKDLPLERGVLLHLVLEVKDSGSPALTSYRRIVIQPVDRNFSAPGDNS